MSEDDEIENYKFQVPESVDDDPDDADVRRFDRDGFVKCPHCGKANHAEAQRCRFCKFYITEDPSGGKPLWMRVTLIVMIIMMVLAIVWGFGDMMIHFDFKTWGR